MLWKIVMHCVDSSLDVANEFINIFGYRSNLPVLDEANQLLDSFEAHIFPAWSPNISTTTSIVRLEAVDVEDGVQYLDRPISPAVPGDRGGDPLPGFVAWGYKYQRATLGKRSGAKRFGRLIENQIADGNAVPGELPALNALADALAAPLPIGITDTWFPEILERKPVGVFPWTSHPISGVIYQRVTTQNSRKR